jgi:flavodoxin
MLKKRKLTILYGSQTGCAQEVAERIFRLAKKRCFDVSIFPMNSFNFVKLIFLNSSGNVGKGEIHCFCLFHHRSRRTTRFYSFSF